MLYAPPSQIEENLTKHRLQIEVERENRTKSEPKSNQERTEHMMEKRAEAAAGGCGFWRVMSHVNNNFQRTQSTEHN